MHTSPLPISFRNRFYLKSITYLIIILCTGLLSCKWEKDKEKDKEDLGRAAYQIERNPVDTIILHKGIFKNQLISNGKLRALKKGEMRFLSSGIISNIKVKNGSKVREGDVLAQLDSREAKIRLEQSEYRYQRMLLNLHEALITIGFLNLSDTAKLTPERRATMYNRSDYYTTIADRTLAEISFENLTLKAPFSGVVANLNSKTYERTSDIFCTLIDDSVFEVEFSVLESEIGELKPGLGVKVSPFTAPDKVFTGKITQINPVVDERGQIAMRAEIRNNGELLEGMNVKVFIEQDIPDMLVVPKSAVLIRDNFEVLFRYNPQTGKAMWTYVNVLKSNSSNHSVIANKDKQAELNEGDAIIISGNLNLAHDSDVEIK